MADPTHDESVAFITMTAYKFVKLPTKEKKKIIQSVVRATNEDQRELMRKYKLSFAKGV